MDDTDMIVKKMHSQEFTDHFNSVDEDIKWTTQGAMDRSTIGGKCHGW